MPTITASPGLVYLATNAVTTPSPNTSLIVSTPQAANIYESIFYSVFDSNAAPSSLIANTVPHYIYFKNSSGTILAQGTIANFTRTMAANGYCVLSNFTPVTPVVNGTIAYIEISMPANQVQHDNGQNPASKHAMTLVVGAIGSGADVEIDNRDLTTTQPWRLDGSIRFRVPNTFTYSL